MLVRDEADIVEYTVRHLLAQVDAVIVADNLSSDGTSAILARLAAEFPALAVLPDDEPAYWQARKTTALADLARDHGHEWVVPCDADEFWYATDGRRIADYLSGLAPDVATVVADLYNHIPSALDLPAELDEAGDLLDEDVEANPFRRIGWRQREHGALGKVACRLRPGLEIGAGNHSAWAPGTGMTIRFGLVVRHFSWRSPEQYLHKIRVGEAAYAATDLPESVGAHWRMWAGLPDQALLDHFATWFWKDDPYADETMIYDPAPGA